MSELNITVNPKEGENELTFLQIYHAETGDLIDSIPSNAIPDIEDTINFSEMSGVGIGGLGDLDLHDAESTDDVYVVVDRHFKYIRLDITEESTGETTEALVNNIELSVLTIEEWEDRQEK